MKKLFLVVFLCTGLLLMGTTASAVPFLQLDIEGASSISGTTVGGESGTLVALIDSSKNAYDPNNDYFITLSINPLNTTYAGPAPTSANFDYRALHPGGVGGSIFDPGTTAAPYSQVNHGEGFPSTYWTFGAFRPDFTDLQIVASYDVQFDTPGPPDKPLYAVYFDYDFSNIIGMYGVDAIHFDLYAELNGEFVDKAPFSHDASAVPEPATLLLLGGGLVGLAGFGRKRFKK